MNFSLVNINTDIVLTVNGHKKYIKNPFSNKIMENRYGEIRKRISNNKKIRVGFLVSEASKWQYDELYKCFLSSSEFEPLILVTELLSVHYGWDRYYTSINECFHFFKNKGYDTKYVYDKGLCKYLSLKDFDIDILFYQQPCGLPDIQMPGVVSENSLTAYVPYGCSVTISKFDYTHSFHKAMWKCFYENEDYVNELSLKSGSKIKNYYISGYPRLDSYFLNEVRFSDKKQIIYAPHHSLEDNSLRAATFRENGLKILKFAELYKNDFFWIFKPHPRFKTAIINSGIMTSSEVEDYYSRWEKLGQVYESGDYIQIFKASDALITDCISFLVEYLPSTKPVFHFRRHDTRDLSKWTEGILDSYYSSYDFNSFEKVFLDVMIKGRDFKRDDRLHQINKFKMNENASEKIYNFCKCELLMM